MNFLELLEQHNECYQKHRKHYESEGGFSVIISDAYQQKYTSYKLRDVCEMLHNLYGDRCYTLNEEYKGHITSKDLSVFAGRDAELSWVPFLCFALKDGESLNEMVVKYRYQGRDKSNMYAKYTKHGKPEMWGDEQWKKFLFLGLLCFADAAIQCEVSLQWSEIEQWMGLGHFQPSTFTALMRKAQVDFGAQPPYEWMIDKMRYRGLTGFYPEHVDQWFPLLEEQGFDNSIISNIAFCTKILPYTVNSRQDIIKKIHAFYKEGDSTLVDQFIDLTEEEQAALVKVIKPTLLLRSALNSVLQKDQVAMIKDAIMKHYNINLVDWVHCYDSGLIEKHPKISPANAILKFFGGKVGNVTANEVDLHF